MQENRRISAPQEYAMKALRFTKYGPPSVLAIEELETPKPAAGESLIEIAAAAINPSDVKNVAGIFHAPLPRTPGRDYAGTVVAGYGKGRDVWGSGSKFGVERDGSHAEYVLVPARWLSDKPSRLSMEQASAIGVPFIVAWDGLQAAQLSVGETVLVIGASGAVGRAATQIARWRGARVIGADITEAPPGLDAFIDATAEDFSGQVRTANGNEGVDIVYDGVGGSMFEKGLKSLRTQGRQIAITSMGERRVSFDLPDFYHARLRLIGVDSLGLEGEEIAQIMDALKPGFESGDLRPFDVKPWRLDEGPEAYAAVEKGTGPTKQILVP